MVLLFDPTRLVTDASGLAIAGYLSQLQPDDNTWHPVYFISRALDGNRFLKTGEYALAPRDLELIAISYALEKLRPYLIGVKFTVFSDHESLSYLNASKINSGRLARIIEQLSDYDFTIEYKKGTSGVIYICSRCSVTVT